MPSALHATISGLVPAMRTGDMNRFQDIYDVLVAHAKSLAPEELTAVVEELVPILARRPPGVFARLAPQPASRRPSPTRTTLRR